MLLLKCWPIGALIIDKHVKNPNLGIVWIWFCMRLCVLNVGRGQRELVGVKTGYDIVWNVGRGQRELVGVKTGCDIVCVNVGRGQRELVGVKTGYEMGRVSWNKMCLFKLNSVVCLSFIHDCETLLYYKR